MDPELITAKLAAVEMTPIPGEDGVLITSDRYATHRGLLELPGMPCIRVYQLNDGTRVLAAEDVEGFFARLVAE